MCSQRLISHCPLSLISVSPCLPDAADTWVSLHPKRARPLWSWTCGRRSISTAATSTSWPRSWLTSANRKPWYSWSPMASANPETGTEDTANVPEQKNSSRKRNAALYQRPFFLHFRCSTLYPFRVKVFKCQIELRGRIGMCEGKHVLFFFFPSTVFKIY